MIPNDATRLAAIHQLDAAIAAKQPALNLARAGLASARGIEAERRSAVAAINTQLKQFTTEILQTTSCVYLKCVIAANGVADVEGPIRTLQEQRNQLLAQQRQLDTARQRAAKAEMDALRKKGKR